MAKQQILLVDADSSSARLLEVSLRSAGFTVATADSAEAALAKLEHGTPDLILTDTALPKADGFSFVRKLRARPESATVPVVFLTEQGALEDKLRGLELGVDDYLAKPIFVREVVTRVQLLLARKRQRIAPEPARTRFSGSLEDVAVVDVLQTIAVSGKSGVASVRRGDREAWLYFDRGQVIDAEVGDLRGEEAVYRTISWTTGSFDLEFRPCDRPRVIDAPYQALLMEGLRRVDELGRIAEQLPPEDAVIDLDHAALASRLNEIPDELNAILRLIDGKRTLLDLIDASPFDDLSTLTVLSKFYFEGLISSSDMAAEPSERPLAAPARAPSPPNGAAHDAERDMGEVATLVPSSPPSTRDIGEVATLVPPSRSTPAAAMPTVPPARLPQTSPPSTVPAEVAPPREARRETPAPVTARAASPSPPVEGKLTPKGIVNVGEHGASKASAAPSRVASELPRRSPIPMPDGSLRVGARNNGALHASGLYADELRQTRTSLGLSAVPLQRPSANAEYPRPLAPEAAERSPSPPAAESPESQAVVAAETRPPSAPGSHPESEQEFFEAGDVGTYQGGPLSEVPELRLDGKSVEPPPAPKRRPANPVRGVRARRSKLIVAVVLLLSAVPLVIGLVRRLASPAASPPSAEPSAVLPAPPAPPPSAPVPPAAPAPPPVEAAPVSPPPSAPAVAAPTPAVEPAATASTPPAAAAPPVAAAAPTVPAPSAAAPAAPSSPPPRKAPAAAAPASAPPASPRPAPPPRATRPVPPPAKPVEAPAPAPAAPTRPALPPLDLPMAPPMAPPLPKPGEKPPTAAYPLPSP